MVMNWRTAYFQQAKSDYEMLLRLLKEEDIPLCHCLHYLQMTTEKLAKGFRTERRGGSHIRTHDVFYLFVKKYAALNQSLYSACHMRSQPQYIEYLKDLHDLAEKIENLSPDGPDHPNPEYPWQIEGNISVPVSYPFSEIDLRRRSAMTKMLKFIAACFKVIEAEVV